MPEEEKKRTSEHPEEATGRPRLSKPKAVFATLLLLTVSTGVALLGAEFAIRLVSPQQLILVRPDIWMAVDSLGWERRPNANTRVNWGERDVHLYTDEEGFRVGAEGRTMASDSVLLIGDSFMAALQVEYEQSLAGLIESRSVGPRGERVAVRDAGVGGWAPDQYLLFARRRLRDHRYSAMIVAVFVGNDVLTTRFDYYPPRRPVERAEFRVPRSFAPSEWVSALARPINDMLEERSHLFVFAKNRLEPLRIRLGLSVSYVPDQLLKSHANGEEWAMTADILADLDSIARSHDTPALFVLIPERYQVDLALFRAHARAFGLDTTSVDIDQPSERLLKEMDARGLNTVDALQGFREAEKAGPHLYGVVDAHLSPTGHRILYELVEPKLREALWGTPPDG